MFHSSLVSYVFCGVLLCCVVFQFIAPVLSLSLFFVLGSLLFQLGVRAFGPPPKALTPSFSLYAASPLRQ